MRVLSACNWIENLYQCLQEHERLECGSLLQVWKSNSLTKEKHITIRLVFSGLVFILAELVMENTKRLMKEWLSFKRSRKLPWKHGGSKLSGG